MTHPRISAVVLWTLFAAAAAAAAVSLNLLLLGHSTAASDPVGRLTSRARLPAAPRWTIRPTHGRLEARGLDD